MSIGYNTYFIGPASVVPVVQRTYGIDNTLVGLVYSACLVGVILFSIPGGLVVDRYDTRHVMAWATVGFAVAIGLGSFVVTYPVLLFTRFLACVASVFLFTMNANVVGDVFPPDQLGLTTSVYVASPPTAFALAQFATPRLVDALTLRGAFGAYGAVSVVGLLTFLVTASSPIRSGGDVSLSAVGAVV